jgi:alkanesulfonate monooxygenase
MAGRDGQMVLGVFFNHTGHHVASWRHPGAQADAGVNLRHYIELAQTAERAKFHFLFFADWLAVRDASDLTLSRSAQYTAHFEPLTLLGGLAAVTEQIGLVCTATTSYNEPFHIARKMASLDHMSGGRAAWNVVTSAFKSEAFNFGREHHYAHEDRYERAREFVDVVKGLWDSWDDDAFPRDKESGIYLDPKKLHALNHDGKYLRVRGPLNVPRPPQGYPVIVQAGASDTGRELAAATAEVVFTSPLDIAAGKAFYDDVKGRMAKYGRHPDELKILPGLSATVAETDAEADEKFEYLQSLIHPEVGREILSMVLEGADLSGCDLDGPLPELNPMPEGGTPRGVVALARRENLTLRQLYLRLAGARGKRSTKGSVTRVADELEEWYRAGACDGFILQPAYLPGSLDEACTLLIPELQRRGLFQTEYRGKTLRDHLGLARPRSRYAKD